MKKIVLETRKLTVLTCLFLVLKISAQNPGLIISELMVNPSGTDSPFEYVEFRVSKNIDFSITPYSVIVSNNGTATSAGWVAGGSLTYGFSINTGTVAAGDVVYVGGSSMAPTGIKLRTINTGTIAGDGFGAAATGGVFGNGGGNADGVAVFAADIATITNTTVPVDAIFYGTAIGTATTATGGYELPVNDLYTGGKVQTSSFLASDPGAVNLIATGTFDPVSNTYTSNRVWSTGALTDGTSSVVLSSVLPPANLAFTVDNQTILESIGTVTANISITSSNSNPSSVEVVVIPFGTAGVGSDLAYTTQTVTFPANATGTLPLTITINDDAIAEESEYFVIKLQNPVNASLSGIIQQTIFIKDNDANTPVGNNEVSMTFVSSFTNGVSGTNSAEIVAHDPISQRLFVANSIGKKLDIIDFSNPANMSIINSIDISSYGNINSVAVKNGIVACAIENTVPEQDGFVVFFNTNGVFQKQVTVGALPDMVTFNHAGTKVLTANEGQPNVGYTIDPEGSVSIIDISGGIASLSQSNVTTALFTAFNSQSASLKASGVRIYGSGASVAQDMEPEYITVSDDDLTAYVTLQENNAFAYVNLTTNTITDIKPLGFKDHSVFGNGLDATNNGSNVNIANFPIKGMYLPDALSHFNVGGVEYLITANEGDSRADYGAANNEETTIGAATYSLDPTVFPYASVMKSNANLGKLKCTNRTGDIDNDGDFDEIYTFGTRSFSIWNATTGTLVYDSGDDLEQITANDPTYGVMFNCSNTNITKKDRSDDKGPEPEGVTVAMIAGKPYAFVSMERVGGLMVFNISNPASPQFVQYVNNRGLTGLTGDRGPEGIIYVTQPNSPTGKAYIVLGNEVSSSVSVYEIACPSSTASVTSLTTTACEGETLTVTTNTLSGATYTWYNGVTAVSGATTSVYNATTTGSYSVKLDNVGCVIPSNTVSLTFNALPSVSATTSNTLLCSGQSATLTATSSATSYTWSDGATTITTVVSPTITTDYTITVNDGLCGSSAVITQSVNTCTGLTSNDKNNVLRVYPNPFTHFFKVNWNTDFTINKEVSIYIYNVLGELVYTEKTNDTEISINTKDWKNGSYFIKVNNTVSKIVKQD
ncbi:MAG: choice-of-anchor I family protein [Bacteroidia bacterium]|nr:choice-of-anchor I family protein [Bacteroidia bacterium]